MRILVVSPYLPWPLNSGGNAAQFATLQCLAADHEFTLVCPVHTELQQRHAEELGKRLPDVRIRGIYCGEPLPRSSSLRQLARALRFAVRRIAPASRGANLPGYPFQPLAPALIEAVGEELRRGTDLVQAEFAAALSLGAWLPPETPRIFVHHQIHFIYAERHLETHGKSSSASYLSSLMRVQELTYLRRFNAVITFSEEDRRALVPHLQSTRVFTSPFPIPTDVGIASELPEKFDGRFLFVASDIHDPNIDALEWLVSEIWPEIVKHLPTARLVVIGQWSRTWQKRLGGPSISFSGFVPDLTETMRGGIMLVPVRIGSGIRTKILAALAQGVPVVTTAVGAEGLLARDGEDLLVAADAPGFASAAVRLAQDPALRKRLGAGGRAAVSDHYSAEQVRRQRNEIYAEVVTKKRVGVAHENLATHPVAEIR